MDYFICSERHRDDACLVISRHSLRDRGAGEASSQKQASDSCFHVSTVSELQQFISFSA